MKARRLLREFQRRYPSVVAYGIGGTDIDGLPTQLAHPRCLDAHNKEAGNMAIRPNARISNPESVRGLTCTFCKAPIAQLDRATRS